MRKRSIFNIIVLIIFASNYSAGQQVKYIKKDYPKIPSLMGYVNNEIVIEVANDVLLYINKSQGEKIGRCEIPGIDRVAGIYNVTKIIQQFPDAIPKVYMNNAINLKNWFKIHCRDSINIDTMIKSFLDLPEVLKAEPIGIHYVSAQYPNDGFFSEQWHLDQSMDHDVDAPEAWDSNTGNINIIVAMMDSGVRYYHKDLGGVNATLVNRNLSRGNIWLNTDELNGVASNDDDGNSYTDDWIGWDFVTGVSPSTPYSAIAGEDYNIADNNPADFNGHGTHCAGNISAINNNGYAGSSVSGGWGNGSLEEFGNGVKIMALRIGYSAYHSTYGEVGLVRTDFAASALVYAANNGARIASCSWGSSNSGGLGTAIDYFLASGGLIFKAAGNDGADLPDYMANRSDENIIDVASTDLSDLKSDFSNYGAWIDISAPGSDILSSYHVHSDPTNDYVATLNGTSMATPIAASVAALIWSANPLLNNDQVRLLLYNNTDDIESLNASYIGQLGVGRVNAYNAMQDPSLPVTLTLFKAISSKNGIELNWTTESEIENLGFILERKTENDIEWKRIADHTTNDALKGQGNSSSRSEYFYVDENVEIGNQYEYRIADVSYTGTITYLKTVEIEFTDNLFPKNFTLNNAYPNPFNPVTQIRYGLPEQSKVIITLFDISGRKVKTLINTDQEAGWYDIQWNGNDEQNRKVSSGMYLYKMTAENFTQVRKILLIR